LVRGEWESFVRGRGSDLYRIREYMPEDSARHVDWKATAKSGSLKVREFAREDERKLCIAFDNPEEGLLSESAYEKAVELAASLASHFSSQDAEVSFLIPGRPRSRDFHQFMEWLALVQPLGSKLKAAPLRTAEGTSGGLEELGRGPADEYKIVITARGRGSIPTALWNSSYFVFVGQPGLTRA